MFGSVLFSEYGLTTKVITGNVQIHTLGGGGRHAWIQVYDRKGRLLEIIDSNNTRSVHPDFNDYVRVAQGAEALVERQLVIAGP